VKFINTSVCSKDEDSCDDASNGDVTFFHQTYLGLSFDFSLTGLGPSLIEIGESISPHFA
jgi:hypothetical protein